VSIPGFGAFIVQYTDARYDISNHLYYPPTREIVFNPAVNHNDGILASSISRKENIDFDIASRIVTEETDIFRAHLSSEGELSFGNLGHFKSENNKYVFYPAKQPNYFLPVNILPYSLSDDNSNNAGHDRQAFHTLNRTVQIAASIIVLFIMGILLSTPISVEHSTVAYAKAEIPGISMPKKARIIDSLAVELMIAYPTDNEAVAEYHKHIRDPFAGKYGLVVASLVTNSQVGQYMASHPRHNLKAIHTDRRIRIIAAGADSAVELMRIASQPDFKKEFPEAWTCRK